MKKDAVLDFAATNELIALVNLVEGKILFSLLQIDQAEDQRLRSSHRAATEAFTEQLKVVLLCLQQRANGDAHAAGFLAQIQAGDYRFQIIG